MAAGINNLDVSRNTMKTTSNLGYNVTPNMITEFEEHSQGASKVQFTVSRSSLPSLLDWSERLKTRFQVEIEIQWELDPDADRLGDASQVRWVSVSGDADNCKKAKNYITIFCDAPHRMNVNYPETIDARLKESQVRLEETYSAVLQFVKVGQLIIKSSDDMSLTLVLSVIEEIASRFPTVENSPQPHKSNWRSFERHQDSTPSLFLENELETDSSQEYYDSTERPHVPKLQVKNQPLRASKSLASSSIQDSNDLLGGGSLKLRVDQRLGVCPGQIIDLISDDGSSQSSVSPDRKKLKSYSPEHENHPSQPLPKLPVLDFGHSKDLSTFKLTPQQEHAVVRILQKGDFSKSEVLTLLQKVRNNWQCCDLITLLHTQKSQDSVSTSALHHKIPSFAKLKSTQESLMHNLRDSLPEPVLTGTSSEMYMSVKQSPSHFHRTSTLNESQTRFENFPLAIQDVKKTIKTEERCDETGVDEEMYMSVKQSPPHSHRTSTLNKSQTRFENLPLGIQDVKNTIKTEERCDETQVDEGECSADDTDSIIIIPSESEPELLIEDTDSDTQEVFLIKSPVEVKSEKSASRLPHDGSKHTAWSPSSSAAEVQQTKELRGVVEKLQEQLKELQAKMEREKAEASNQQQVVTLLQQTQQEEMERQYAQQQEKLLEQQQRFQNQFETQEKKLKAEQELALKQLRQQQQQQRAQPAATPLSPSEPIVIAPAKKNPASPLRPVVIDGSNVAMSHGRKKVFSCRGIAICVQYFQRRGHQDITVFVPQGRRTQNPNSVDRPMREQRILEDLEKQGLLSFTPSRRIGHSYVNCYDDRFIVKLAVENGGVIVSNDNFRDLMGVSPEWRHVVENRLVMYTFAGDRFMIPDDPMGRGGPTIEQLLRRPLTRATDTRPTSHPVVLGASELHPTFNYAIPGLHVPASTTMGVATPALIKAAPTTKTTAAIPYTFNPAIPGLHVPTSTTMGVATLASVKAAPSTKTTSAVLCTFTYAIPGLHVPTSVTATEVSTKGTGAATKGTGAATRGTGAATRGTGAATRGTGAATRGTGAAARGTGAAAKGTGAAAKGTGAAAKGTGAAAKGTGAAAKGTGAAAKGTGAAAKGTGAAAKGTGAAAIGTGAATKGTGAATKPTAASGFVPWGAGSVPGSQIVRQGTDKSAARSRPPAQAISGTLKPKRAPATPKMSRKSSLEDPTQHPCYDALMAIFPDNKAEVVRVISKFGSEKDPNELVIHVLVEKEKMEVETNK